MNDLLDPDQIKANLKTKRIGRKILVYDSTSSTNDIAAEYARNKQNDGLVVFAEEQTAGRGRAGNKWLSGKGDSILCSIVLSTGGSRTAPTELLSLTCAVAVAEAIGKPGRNQAKIKWPNDIMLNGKKVAGILLESKRTMWHGLPARDTQQQRVAASKPKALGMVEPGRAIPKLRLRLPPVGSVYVVGIGINCHQRKDSFPEEQQSLATSMDIESHSITDRISLAKRLLVSMDHWLEVAVNNGDKIIGRWRELSIQLGHRVTLLFNGNKFTGNCIGIDPEKGLILQLDTGGVRMFDAAHSTIAK